jgi:hypothetical protein
MRGVSQRSARGRGGFPFAEGVGGKRLVNVGSGDVSPYKCNLGDLDLESVFHFGRLGESTPFVYLEKGAKEAVGSLEQPFGFGWGKTASLTVHRAS